MKKVCFLDVERFQSGKPFGDGWEKVGEMKKIQIVCIIGGMMFLLSACSSLTGRFDFGLEKLQGESDSICKTILESFESNDSEKIKNLFSEKTVKETTDLDNGISENLVLYKDSGFTYECLGNSIREYRGDSKNECKINGKYVLTDQEGNQFLLWFIYWDINEQNPNEVGVSLIVITDYTDTECDWRLEEILGYERTGIYWSGWDRN